MTFEVVYAIIFARNAEQKSFLHSINATSSGLHIECK